jgi:hypothetical protein
MNIEKSNSDTLNKYQLKIDIAEAFECLVIKQGSTSSLSWRDPNYSYKLMELGLIASVKVDTNNFEEILATQLQVNNFNVPNLSVCTEIIGEEPNYLYEMLYIDLEKQPKYHTDVGLNEIASLFNINGEKVYSNAIVFKSQLLSLTDNMKLCTVTKNDLARVLYERAHTKIVTYNLDDSEWREENVIDLDVFAKQFFEEEYYQKLEIAFLMHNINVWYIVDSNKKNQNKTCGKIINNPIEKCIWFSMKTDTYRGNLSLKEVEKIIYLSNILESFKTPPDLLEERFNEMGGKIINNKYKVLDWVYHNNK